MKNSMTRFGLSKALGRSLGCAALLLGGISLFCFAEPVSAGGQVPFKGTFDPTVVGSSPSGLTYVFVTVQATQLGNAQGPATFAPTPPGPTSGIIAYVGGTTWYGADGDSVTLTFAGKFVPTPKTGIYNNVETFRVVGGTGRFEGATGSGVCGGQVDISTSGLTAPAPLPFNGTISSPGANKQDFYANGGTTFVLFPTSDPYVATHTIDGVVRVSLLGNCQFHAIVNLAYTAPPTEPFFANELFLLQDGVFTITTADGSSTLTASAEGYATLNANLYMLDIHYVVRFTGGTGELADARGSAELDGFAMFTDVWVTATDNPGFSIFPPATDYPGKACWIMRGDLDLHGDGGH
jgi:hypothetical protein